MLKASQNLKGGYRVLEMHIKNIPSFVFCMIECFDCFEHAQKPHLKVMVSSYWSLRGEGMASMSTCLFCVSGKQEKLDWPCWSNAHHAAVAALAASHCRLLQL